MSSQSLLINQTMIFHNSFGITEYSNPYDINYSEIPYDDYKLIVTSAYQNSIPYQGDAYR